MSNKGTIPQPNTEELIQMKPKIYGAGIANALVLSFAFWCFALALYLVLR